MHDADNGQSFYGRGIEVTNGEKKAILLEYRAIERRINPLNSMKKAAWNAIATATNLPPFRICPESGGGS